MNITPDLLKNETDIVWTCDVSKFPYVRQMLVEVRRRRGPIRDNERVVGWSNLAVDASAWHGSRFLRRVFTIRSYDRALNPDGVYRKSAPMEAVDPQTVGAGVAGELTPRAAGRETETRL